MLKIIKKIMMALFVLVIGGLIFPENMVNPVESASSNDWNHQTFWYEPWGTSGVHKGIDIFGVKNTPVIAPVSGIVIFSGTFKKGGTVVAVLGPKWRIHYVAHLNLSSVNTGDFVTRNNQIGTLGDTGNAAGKPPHVHYSILSLIPYPWLATTDSQGWKRMFFLNPDEKLRH